MSILPVHTYVYNVHALPREYRRGCLIPGTTVTEDSEPP